MKLSRQVIREMDQATYEANEAAILRWWQAGAVDDTEAPPLVRPDGHCWTKAEVAGLTVEEFDANADQLLAATAAGDIHD